MLSIVWSLLLTPFENAIGAWRGGKAERLGLLSRVAKNEKDILTFWMLYLKSNVQLVLKEPEVPVNSSWRWDGLCPGGQEGQGRAGLCQQQWGSRSRAVPCALCWAALRPQLECCVQFWPLWSRNWGAAACPEKGKGAQMYPQCTKA